MCRRSFRFVIVIVFAISSFLCVSFLCASFLRASPANQPQADKIVIVKSARAMTLLSGGKVIKTYKVALGGVSAGPKRVEGDHKTPEGSYIIDAKNPQSQFHLSLHISYPSAADSERARKLGARPGGAIMIHGLAKSFAYLGALHRQTDWTDGCIAVTNAEIEEIWKMVPVGTRVEIRP
ncbi:MAG TPA: L,D-transpeptidase family protein [Candidatus Angelobacter sp.]|jgi:murein L,D-transpeptidase YafK|nr:L,D-transpeptidase family protein [Candidatus Angelobacter sp.]